MAKLDSTRDNLYVCVYVCGQPVPVCVMYVCGGVLSGFAIKSLEPLFSSIVLPLSFITSAGQLPWFGGN